MGYFYKKYRKNIFKSLLLLDILAFLYYLAVGVMYIVSMPYEEALYLAGFGRYMLTLIITLTAIKMVKVRALIDLTSKVVKVKDSSATTALKAKLHLIKLVV